MINALLVTLFALTLQTTAPARGVAFNVLPADHQITTDYLVTIRQSGAVVRQRNIGKPTPDTVTNEIQWIDQTFFEGLAAGTFQVDVSARGSNGSSVSIPVELIVGSTDPPPPGGFPAAPSELRVRGLGPNYIALAWLDNANNEIATVIERCEGVNCANFAQVFSAPANTSPSGEHIDEGLKPGTSYSYRAKATNAAGSSLYSNTVTGVTEDGPTSPDGTRVPPAAEIVDNTGATWTLAGTQPGFHAVIRNGNPMAFAASQLTWCQGVVRALAGNSQWYAWGGSSFAPVGTVDLCQTQPVPTKCEWSWGNWTDVSTSCVNGVSTTIQQRTAIITKPGDTCDAPTTPETQTITGTCPVTPPPPSITLTATAQKLKSIKHVALKWSGATTSQVIVKRNGVTFATTANDGSETLNLNSKGGGSETFQVCEVGTSVCSAIVTVTW